MLRRSVTALLVLLVLGGTAQARELEVEVEVLHVGGMLTPAELDTLLADERLFVEANYYPNRLIDGVTARRERQMPIGTRLIPIPQLFTLPGAQIQRQGRLVRFKLPDSPPEYPDHRIVGISVKIPMLSGFGRPAPNFDLGLLNEGSLAAEPREVPIYYRSGTINLGVRLRYRWSDARSAPRVAGMCLLDVHMLGDGKYRFPPQHRSAGFFEGLSSTVQSDPPSRPPQGQRSLRMQPPYPEPLGEWRLSRNHLVQIQSEGQTLERLSVYGEQSGEGTCRRSRSYEALYANGQPVVLQLNAFDYGCPDGDSRSRGATGRWLDDGSLESWIPAQGGTSWSRFASTAPGKCAAPGEPPAAGDVEALKSELGRVRAGFLR